MRNEWLFPVLLHKKVQYSCFTPPSSLAASLKLDQQKQYHSLFLSCSYGIPHLNRGMHFTQIKGETWINILSYYFLTIWMIWWLHVTSSFYVKLLFQICIKVIHNIIVYTFRNKAFKVSTCIKYASKKNTKLFITS